MLSLRNLCLTPDLKDVLFSPRSVTVVDFYLRFHEPLGVDMCMCVCHQVPTHGPHPRQPDHTQASHLCALSVLLQRLCPRPANFRGLRSPAAAGGELPYAPTMPHTLIHHALDHVLCPPHHHTVWFWEHGPSPISMIMAPSTLLVCNRHSPKGCRIKRVNK